MPSASTGLSALALASCALAQSPPSYSQTCNVKSQYAASNSTADDSPAITAAFTQCANGGTVSFAEGVDYNVFTPINATGLNDVTIEIYGNLHLPQNISYVQSLVNATSTGHLYWFTFQGPDTSYVGTSNVTTGWIYSYGQVWWNANRYPGTGTAGCPHLMSFNTTNGSMQSFKSRKPIAWNIQVIGSGIQISDTVIDAFSTTGSFPFNTDGFDVTGTNIAITDPIIYNGDDAIAVQSGSHDVLFQGGTIGYQSRGMSIGSLGQNQASFANVSNVHFDDIITIDAVYAARFKSWQGGQGIASNISWTNIKVYNVTFPIFVTQTYINQVSMQTQIGAGSTCGRPINATVDMEDFTWANSAGTFNTFKPGDGSCVTDASRPSVLTYMYVMNHADDVSLAVLPSSSSATPTSSCKNFEFSNIDVFPQSLDAPSVVCINATSTLNPDLGFNCANGTYVPTT